MNEVVQKGRSLYHELGGEEAIRRLVEIFYDIVEQDEEAAELHLLHRRGHGVAHSREEQFNYLCGFFGGPSYYVQKHGHSRLKEIHEHVAIGPELRDLWLKCMRQAVDKAELPERLQDLIMRHFTFAAETTRNRE
ncbi:hemoglobin [Aminobacter niigataensis]|uniref:Hemoglobin n=1 Tax=Aminobacter niigataensis TaxID=83265 RepID=A0ABR6L7V9_9HYPH|nr:group II truncated hemoglobin [Aminobacter niigataensis]MBB4652259.1 hemoglobin [Aminobacter niigataensis]